MNHRQGRPPSQEQFPHLVICSSPEFCHFLTFGWTVPWLAALVVEVSQLWASPFCHLDFSRDNNHKRFNICYVMNKCKKLTFGGDRGALLIGRKWRFSSASMLLLLSSLGHLLFLLNFSSNNRSSSHGKLLFLFG